MQENNEQKEINKPKIVPSYAKKDNQVKEKPKRFKSKITKFIILGIVILIVIIIISVSYNLILNNKYKAYVQYETNMNKYGFNRMYDNSTADTTEKITKSELVKVVVSSLLNKYDISDIWPMDKTEYQNHVWVDYAEQKGLITQGYITVENENKRATYIEALTILSNYKKMVLTKDLDIESSPKYNDFDKYTNEEQTLIKDMVWNKILDDSDLKLNAYRKIVKGELNQLIIKFVEKYNTVTISLEDKLNINSEKLPYNYEDYTYTLANINKSVYEAKFDYEDVSKSKLPKDMYVEYKEEISDWIIMINDYYNTILNVDYNNFDKNLFQQKVNAFVINNYELSTIEEYEKYIIDNKIVIDGSVNVQMPIIYNDGENIRVRTKLQYNIISSNTNENLLFGDLSNLEKVVYNEDSVITYIDVKLVSISQNPSALYLSNSNVNNLVVSDLQ